MSIWFKEYTIDELEPMRRGTMMEHLEMEIVEIGEDYLKATMPVDHRTVQPMGLLHGGASLALAESLGSVAGTLCLNPETSYCVGVEINANHIRSVREGRVTGITKPVHLGKMTQVWEIKIFNEQDNLVCISRITLAVIQKS
ncbi:MAG: hotdog fold thioesterase [Calditrichia bacterium]